jgi:hypothetical protein
MAVLRSPFRSPTIGLRVGHYRRNAVVCAGARSRHGEGRDGKQGHRVRGADSQAAMSCPLLNQ